MHPGFVSRDKTALATRGRLNRCLEPLNIRVVLFTNNDVSARERRRYRPFRHQKNEWRDYNYLISMFGSPPHCCSSRRSCCPPSAADESRTQAGWTRFFRA